MSTHLNTKYTKLFHRKEYSLNCLKTKPNNLSNKNFDGNVSTSILTNVMLLHLHFTDDKYSKLCVPPSKINHNGLKSSCKITNSVSVFL